MPTKYDSSKLNASRCKDEKNKDKKEHWNWLSTCFWLIQDLSGQSSYKTTKQQSISELRCAEYKIKVVMRK